MPTRWEIDLRVYKVIIRRAEQAAKYRPGLRRASLKCDVVVYRLLCKWDIRVKLLQTVQCRPNAQQWRFYDRVYLLLKLMKYRLVAKELIKWWNTLLTPLQQVHIALWQESNDQTKFVMPRCLHQSPGMNLWTHYKIDNYVFLVKHYTKHALRMPVSLLLGYTSHLMAQQDVVALD